jgi:hypothetical protein
MEEKDLPLGTEEKKTPGFAGFAAARRSVWPAASEPPRPPASRRAVSAARAAIGAPLVFPARIRVRHPHPGLSLSCQQVPSQSIRVFKFYGF